MSGPPARGLLVGTAVSVLLWLVIFAAASWLAAMLSQSSPAPRSESACPACTVAGCHGDVLLRAADPRLW